jgi:phosphoribosyl 1,2-cyclic phosphodiesterase
MRFSVLASGSSGNSMAFEHDGYALLLDAGLGLRDTLRRMEAAGLGRSMPSAILLSHEHSDHCNGADVIARRLGIPVLASAGTLAALSARLSRVPGRIELGNGSSIDLGPFRVSPFSLPHDASDPSGYVIEWDGGRLGIATDLGSWGHLVARQLSGCSTVVLEFNHDVGMLWNGSYPWPLKQRIASSTGHLSNSDAAMLIDSIMHPGMENLVLAHLSRENNTPETAESVARTVTGPGFDIFVGSQSAAMTALEL